MIWQLAAARPAKSAGSPASDNDTRSGINPQLGTVSTHARLNARRR